MVLSRALLFCFSKNMLSCAWEYCLELWICTLREEINIQVNHRVAEPGRHLRGLPKVQLSSLLPKASSPGPCPIQRLNKLLGQPMPSSVPIFMVKKCFFKCSVQYFSLGLLPLVLSSGTTEKTLSPSSLHPLISFNFMGIFGIDTRKLKCFLLWHITKTAEVLYKEF